MSKPRSAEELTAWVRSGFDDTVFPDYEEMCNAGARQADREWALGPHESGAGREYEAHRFSGEVNGRYITTIEQVWKK